MKWAVLGLQYSRQRFEVLHRFLNDKVPNQELHFLECSPSTLQTDLEKALLEFDSIRIESPFGSPVLSHFKQQTMQMATLRACDALIKRDGQWWPESGLYLAFNELLSRHGRNLDLGSEVLIVGAGAAARIAVASLARAGFKRINIASKFDDEGFTLVTELKGQYYGCHFEFVPEDRLVLLPGTNILVINTTPLVDSNDLLQELYYLNFLKREGMIWDLVITPATTPLIREGEQIEVKCIRGFEVAAIVDLKWIEWTFNLRLDLAELHSVYRSSFPDVGLVTKNGTPG